MHRAKWLCVLGIIAALGWTGAAVAQVTVSFESYALGDLNGQDGWAWDNPAFAGSGTVKVINTDNGPSVTGTKCVEMISANESLDTTELLIHKALTNQVPVGGGIVALQYDIRWTNGQPNNSGINTRCRMYDTSSGFGIMPAHWWGLDTQYYGAQDPAGASLSWVGNIDGSGVSFGNGYSNWTTWKWVAYFGTGTGATTGQLLYVEVDGVRYTRFDSYIPATVSMLDQIKLMLYTTDTGWSTPADRDIVHYDNLIITSTPGTPSDIPVADAGPDQPSVAGTALGGIATLDASNSYDDGNIVQYRWLNMDESDYYARTLAVSTSPVSTVTLPNGTTTNVRLEVVDNDGLQSFDDMVVTVGAWSPPAIDNVWGPFGIKAGDLYGRSQSDYVLPSGKLRLIVKNQRAGLPDPAQDRQLLFDFLGNVYFVTWNGFVRSLTPQLNDRWISGDQGDTRAQGLIIGERYLYAVASLDPIGFATFSAIRLDDGSTVWTVDLGGVTGEVLNVEETRWKWTLYDNKIYFVGEPGVLGGIERYIYQIDASTGNVDWYSLVNCGGRNDDYGVNGIVAFVPDAYGTGLHGMFFQERSDSESDGVADAVALQIDPNPTTGGASVVWGVDAGFADRSYPIYSDTTGLIYMCNQSNWAGKSTWVFDKNSGLLASYTTSGNDRPRDPTTALDFDGRTVHSANDMGVVYSETDGDGTGMNMTLKQRQYDLSLLNPNNPTFGGYFGSRGIVMQNTDGDTMMVTAHEQWWYNPDGGTLEDRGPTQIAILNLTQDDGTPTEADIDDGPIYIDNVVVKEDSTTVFTDNFESYPLGPLTLPNAKWSYTGDVGAPAPEIVLDPDNAANKVLKLDPFGGNSYQYVGIAANLGGNSYPISGDVMTLQWNQRRHDLTDNVTTDTTVGGVFQWDGAGDPAYQKAWGYGTDPDWSRTALLQTGTWEPVVVTWDYSTWLYDLTVNGTNEGGLPPTFDAMTKIDTLEFGMEATPPTSSGWTAPQFVPAALFQASTFNTTVANEWDWDIADALSVSPDGSIYFFQYKSYDRRYTRLATCLVGDSNCDGTLDLFDIDPFVIALTNPAQWNNLYSCDFDCANDIDGNGTVDLFDIDPFVMLLTGG